MGTVLFKLASVIVFWSEAYPSLSRNSFRISLLCNPGHQYCTMNPAPPKNCLCDKCCGAGSIFWLGPAPASAPGVKVDFIIVFSYLYTVYCTVLYVLVIFFSLDLSNIAKENKKIKTKSFVWCLKYSNMYVFFIPFWVKTEPPCKLGSDLQNEN